MARFLDNEMACQLYYAYIFPHISYGIELYGIASKTHIRRLQTVQNRILKILTCKPVRYSTNRLHNEIGLLTVENVHTFFINIFVYKQQNRMLPVIFNDYFQYNSEMRARTTRQDKLLYVNRCRTTFGTKSVKHLGAQLWNQTANEIRKAPSLPTFKYKYKCCLLDTQTGDS